jgi:hypothetical protein
VVVESGEVPVNGRVATHTVMEGRMQKSDDRMRDRELRGEGRPLRVGPDLRRRAGAFDATRVDFQRLVESFVTD